MYSSRFLSPEQLQEIEATYLELNGSGVADLIDQVGRTVASEVFLMGNKDLDLNHGSNKRVIVLAGPGNNGADGWAAALYLHIQYEIKTTVITTTDPHALEGHVFDFAFDAMQQGVQYIEIGPHSDPTLLPSLFSECDLIVDALLGRGGRAPLLDTFRKITREANASARPIVSIDLPTGVDSRSFEVDRDAIIAEQCLMLFGMHEAFLEHEPRATTKSFWVETFGMGGVIDELYADATRIYFDRDMHKYLPIPARDANKFTRGRVLVVAGSKRYTGAAVLAGLAASSSGAGYVQVAAPETIRPVLQNHLVSAPVVALPEKDGEIALSALEEILMLCQDADALVIGPGLGRGEEVRELIYELVLQAPTHCKIVLDADGLNAFEGRAQDLKRSPVELVLTPHAGEMARLLSIPSDEIAEDPVYYARELVSKSVSVVLKGPVTAICVGDECSADIFAPPTLATAGSGDVLAGLMGSLLAQKVPTKEALILAVRLQGIMASIATQATSIMTVTALGLINALPAAVKALYKEQ